MKVLFLFESCLPKEYHKNTASPGELRVIAGVDEVAQILAIGRKGMPFYELDSAKKDFSNLENKISTLQVLGTGNFLGYYLSIFWLFFVGWFSLLRFKADVIHAESPHLSGVAAVLLGKLLRIPVIVEYRASYDEIVKLRWPMVPISIKRLIFDSLASVSFRLCDYIMANSKAYQEDLISKGYRKVGWYGPGVRPPKIFKGKSHSGIVLGFIGRLYKDKGVDYLLKAMKLLVTRYRENCELLIAGDGPEREHLEKCSQELELDSRIKFLGTQDRWHFFSKIDILINPNVILNALEMVNAEAASVGIPVVTFGNDKRPVTVEDKKTGLVVKNMDIDDMAGAVRKLIKSESLIKDYGENGNALYKKYFTFDIQVKNLENVYIKMNLINEDG